MSDPVWFVELREVLAQALPWLMGGVSVAAINFLKTRLNLTGWRALGLTAVISVLLALGTLVVSGQLNPAILRDATQFSEILLAIALTSQVIYRQLEREAEKRLRILQAKVLTSP